MKDQELAQAFALALQLTKAENLASPPAASFVAYLSGIMAANELDAVSDITAEVKRMDIEWRYERRRNNRF